MKVNIRALDSIPTTSKIIAGSPYGFSIVLSIVFPPFIVALFPVFQAGFLPETSQHSLILRQLDLNIEVKCDMCFIFKINMELHIYT